MADYNVPEELKYSKHHEWLRVVDGDIIIIGITDFAQKRLKDVVYVELPEPGDTFDAGDEFGAIESVKAVSDLFAPITGEIIEANSALEDAPETVNNDPYGEGWMIKVKPSSMDDLGDLMDSAAYSEQCASEE